MEDVFALLRKRREQEVVAQAPQMDELVVKAKKRKEERRKQQMDSACKKYRESHREVLRERERKRRENPEYIKHRHEYYLAHKAEALARSRKSVAKAMALDPEGFKAKRARQVHESYLRNKEKRRERAKEYRKNETEEQRANRLNTVKKWKERNPEKVREHDIRRNEYKREKRRLKREAERRERAIEDNGCGIENVIVNPAGEHRATEKIAG